MNGESRELVGAVVIGRNEGDRLKRCLRSVIPLVNRIVYVDSGSTDGSVEFADSVGVDVVKLDMSSPFTMARGRNAGFKRLMECAPGIQYVQFVDGDCEVDSGWIETALAAIVDQPGMAVVCGRRRERFPEASIYNQLCDLEWDVPAGEVRSCGGDALVRVEAFTKVGGFDASLIAGEEPEFCVRLRRDGWRILRLSAEMTLHDAAMSRFRQWWRRSVRAGHAYAEGAWMHGRSSGRHNVREVTSALLWGMLIPLAAFGLAWPTNGWSLALLGGYPVQWWRINRGQRRRGRAMRDARLYATFTVVAKFSQVQGMATFLLNAMSGRRGRLIEYKAVASQSSREAPPLGHHGAVNS